jgi:hypothetical protein
MRTFLDTANGIFPEGNGFAATRALTVDKVVVSLHKASWFSVEQAHQHRRLGWPALQRNARA